MLDYAGSGAGAVPGGTVDRPMALNCLRDAIVVLQDMGVQGA